MVTLLSAPMRNEGIRCKQRTLADESGAASRSGTRASSPPTRKPMVTANGRGGTPAPFDEVGGAMVFQDRGVEALMSMPSDGFNFLKRFSRRMDGGADARIRRASADVAAHGAVDISSRSAQRFFSSSAVAAMT